MAATARDAALGLAVMTAPPSDAPARPHFYDGIHGGAGRPPARFVGGGGGDDAFDLAGITVGVVSAWCVARWRGLERTTPRDDARRATTRGRATTRATRRRA